MKPSWLSWSEDDLTAAGRLRDTKQYQMGVRDIQIRNREYAPAAIRVTKPFEVEGNVMEISLSVDEEQVAPLVVGYGTAPAQTATEYAVCFVENPSEQDWIPILPSGQDIIKNEQLFFTGNKAYLRFRRNVEVPMSVYRNGIRLEVSDWAYDAENSINIVYRFDRDSIYTATYTPDRNVRDPWNVEIPEEARKIAPYIGADGAEGELFKNGTDRNGRLTLSKYPFVYYDRVNRGDTTYKPVRVQLENAALSGPVKGVPLTLVNEATTPVKTVNVTDYVVSDERVLTSYDPTPDSTGTPKQPQIQFRHEGRTLTFLETFSQSNLITNAGINHGDADIRVRYDYMRTSCRLRIVLRNTTPDRICTPRVSGYTMIFKTMR